MFVLMTLIMVAMVSLLKGGSMQSYYNGFRNRYSGSGGRQAPLSGGGGLYGDGSGQSTGGGGDTYGTHGNKDADGAEPGEPGPDPGGVPAPGEEGGGEQAAGGLPAPPESECGLFWDGLEILTSRAAGGGGGGAGDGEERHIIEMCPSGPDRPPSCKDVAGLLNYAYFSQYDNLARGFCACQEGSGESARCSPAFDFTLQEYVSGVSCTDFADEIACDAGEEAGGG